MIKFSVPTNLQKNLLSGMDLSCVEEFYGVLDRDLIGGGRATVITPHATKKEFAQHVRDIHNKGIKFNYLLNSTCLGNYEWTRKFHKRLNKRLEWLSSLGIERLTIGTPFLLESVKKRFPHFNINVSAMAGVKTLRMAKSWQDLGADTITLSVHGPIRDFKLLRLLKKNLNVKLKLIANTQCVPECNISYYHSNLSAHASQKYHPSGGFFIDYASLSCRKKRLLDPVEFIRVNWIRPEDLNYYQDIGIDMVKFISRGSESSFIKKVVAAYTKRSYRGNFLDLTTEASRNIALKSKWRKFRYMFKPFRVNIFELIKARDVFSDIGIYLDNKCLDGFIEHFLKHSCKNKDCAECGYCKAYADKCLKISDEQRRKALKRLDAFLDKLTTGKMFKYFGK